VPIQSPTLADIFQSAFDARFASFWTAAPGTVQAYDAGSMRATVQPMPLGSYIDEAGERQTEQLPQIGDVQVVFGALTHPLERGDVVLLIFLSCPIEVLSGDNRDDRRNCLTDAVAVPFLSTAVLDRSDNPDDAVVIWTAGADQIRLGSPDEDNVESVMRAPDVEDTIKNLFADSAVQTALAEVTAPGGGAAFATAVNAYFLAHPAQGSSVVKAVD
jgi:hypothetical protein